MFKIFNIPSGVSRISEPVLKILNFPSSEDIVSELIVLDDLMQPISACGHNSYHMNPCIVNQGIRRCSPAIPKCMDVRRQQQSFHQPAQHQAHVPQQRAKETDYDLMKQLFSLFVNLDEETHEHSEEESPLEEDFKFDTMKASIDELGLKIEKMQQQMMQMQQSKHHESERHESKHYELKQMQSQKVDLKLLLDTISNMRIYMNSKLVTTDQKSELSYTDLMHIAGNLNELEKHIKNGQDVLSSKSEIDTKSTFAKYVTAKDKLFPVRADHLTAGTENPISMNTDSMTTDSMNSDSMTTESTLLSQCFEDIASVLSTEPSSILTQLKEIMPPDCDCEALLDAGTKFGKDLKTLFSHIGNSMLTNAPSSLIAELQKYPAAVVPNSTAESESLEQQFSHDFRKLVSEFEKYNSSKSTSLNTNFPKSELPKFDSVVSNAETDKTHQRLSPVKHKNSQTKQKRRSESKLRSSSKLRSGSKLDRNLDSKRQKQPLIDVTTDDESSSSASTCECGGTAAAPATNHSSTESESDSESVGIFG